MSIPAPPHSSGMSIPQQPISPSFLSSASGNFSSRSYARSTGRISVSMNCRTLSRRRICSELREKSIGRRKRDANTAGWIHKNGAEKLFQVVAGRVAAKRVDAVELVSDQRPARHIFLRFHFCPPLLAARGNYFCGAVVAHAARAVRSEERRVGKECRTRWSPDE